MAEINPLGVMGIGFGIGAILLGVIGYKIAPPERKEFVKKLALLGMIFGSFGIIFGCLSLLSW